MKKIITGCVFLGCLSPVFAMPIDFVDQGDYLSDPHSGLDWLDVTTSVNQSYNYVSSQFGADGAYEGWRYATTAEFNTLVSNWTSQPSPITTIGLVGIAEGLLAPLIDMLGSTLDSYYMNYYGQTYNDYWGYTSHNGLSYIYGMTNPVGSNVNLSVIYDNERTLSSSDYIQASILSSLWSTNAVRGDIGSYLVRDTAVVYKEPVTVPEPATFALMGLGLAGIGFFKQRKQKKA